MWKQQPSDRLKWDWETLREQIKEMADAHAELAALPSRGNRRQRQRIARGVASPPNIHHRSWRQAASAEYGALQQAPKGKEV